MKIRCAAIEIRVKTSSIVFVGRDHADIYKSQPKDSLKGGKQGFITECGKFVDRKDAAKIALQAGQITKPIDILFSEDLTGDWPWAQPPARRAMATIKTIKKNCEKLYKEIVLLRDEFCQWCGGSDCLQAHHIIKRSKSMLLFFDLLNLILLCKKCHCKYTNDETAGVRWFSTKFPVRWEYLHSPVVNEKGVRVPRRNCVKSSWHKSDFEEIEIMLKEKLSGLKGE